MFHSASRWTVCRNYAIAAIAAVVVLFVALSGPAHDHMVRDSFKSLATSWNTFLLRKLNAIDTPGTADRLVGAISVALNTGTAEQIEIYDPVCQCGVSISDISPEASPAHKATIAHAVKGLINGNFARGERVEFGPNLHAQPLVQHDAGGLVQHSRSGHAGFLTTIQQHEVQGRAIVIRMSHDTTAAAQTHMVTIWLMGVLIVTFCSLAIFYAATLIHRSRKAEELSLEQARFLAERDPLTRLYNRYGFGLRAEALLRECERTGARGCFIQFDADDFKQVNDMHGHAAGDAVLVALADMIRETFPEGTVAARLGGDEFVVFVLEDNMGDESEMYLGLIPTEVELTETARSLVVSTSVGFAFYPDDGETMEALMRAADLALYAVKQSTKSAVGGYHKDMSDAFERRIWEIEGIREAVEKDQLVAHYQPLACAKTGKIEGVEALVRWMHPEDGLLTPEAFENALSDLATSQLVTRWMLETIVADLARWRAEGHEFSAALNIGEADLRHGALPGMIAGALGMHGLPAEALAIEVTETAVNSSNYQEVLPTLAAIRETGAYIGLDDFGTGTSSITLLRMLPCTALKIDKSFVENMTDNEDDLAVVRALTKLGHDLGLKVVAEGVENLEQFALLNEIGVDLLQGYLGSRPLSSDGILTLMGETGGILGNLQQAGVVALRRHG